MSINLEKIREPTLVLAEMTPAPWFSEYDAVFDGDPEHANCTMMIYGDCHHTKHDARWVALARNDLDVKVRRGWYTIWSEEKMKWFVPHLPKLAFAALGPVEAMRLGVLDVAYQAIHDVGLLSTAEEWIVANVERKNG